MKIRLSPELFELPTQDLLLLGLFAYGWEGVHRIEVDPAQSAFIAWLGKQSPDVREQCELTIDAEILEDAQRPSKTAILVTRDEQSSWSGDPPRVCIEDARMLLKRPFEIWLEDDTSDRAFLRKMLTTEERSLFDDWELRELLRVVHGGGSKLNEGIKSRAKQPGSELQTWVLFDGDGLRSGAPSEQSNTVCKTCEDAGLVYHQLSRRFIESYLPTKALEEWGKARSRERQKNLAIVRAFRRMSAPQRHHYNMKHGFAADEARRAEAGPLYNELDAKDLQRLDHGFGKRIGDLFQDRYPSSSNEQPRFDVVTERDLRRDGGWVELRPQIRKLFDLLGAPA